MFLAAGAVALLCLVSVSDSAPLACEDLVRPLDQLDPRHLEGRWALVAGSMGLLSYLERFRQSESASVKFSSNTSDTHVSYSLNIRSENKCLHNSFNISLNGSSFTYDGKDGSNLTANFAHTSCEDCMLMWMNVESGKWHRLYLFSRRRQLEEKELEEFRAQVECLKMPPPAVMDPTKELCPEETAGHSAAKSEEKTEPKKD